jgi:uncharacterized protein
MERTCVGCGGKGDPGGLVRLSAEGGGRVVLDAGRRLGGRGAWLHRDPACLARALRRKALGRALRRQGLAADAEDLGRALTGIGSRDEE